MQVCVGDTITTQMTDVQEMIALIRSQVALYVQNINLQVLECFFSVVTILGTISGSG